MGRATSILAAGAATLLAVLALAGCGDDPANRHYGTFTDCSTVGRPVVTADPAGDQRHTSGTAATAAPQGDLVGLRVARSAKRLCVEFDAAKPIKPYAAYVLTLRPEDGGAPVVDLEATVLAGQPPDALLAAGGSGGGFRKIDATVGIHGDRLSILVGRGPFVDQRVGAVFSAFRFQARSAVAVADHGRVTDCMPGCE